MTNRELINGLKELGLSDSAVLAVLREQTTTATAAPAAPAAEAPEPAADPVPEPEPTPEPEPAPEPREDRILAAIEKLTGAIFAQNAKFTGRETPAETVDDILAGALRGDSPRK